MHTHPSIVGPFPMFSDLLFIPQETIEQFEVCLSAFDLVHAVFI